MRIVRVICIVRVIIRLCSHQLAPEHAPATPHMLQLSDCNSTLKRSHKEEQVAATNFSCIKKDSASHTVSGEVILYLIKFSVGWCLQSLSTNADVMATVCMHFTYVHN